MGVVGDGLAAGRLGVGAGLGLVHKGGFVALPNNRVRGFGADVGLV